MLAVLPSFAPSRLLSLTGLAPLGAFLLFHVALNATILWGGPTFDDAVAALRRVPALWLIEALIVFAPLAIHAGLGMGFVIAGAPLAVPRPYPRAMSLAVRATGVGSLVFLVAHLFEFRFRNPGLRPGGAELETLLAADLSSTTHGLPWRGAAYLIGTACVSFHFVAGVWGAVLSTRGRKHRWAGPVLGALGAFVWMTFVAVVVFHATGARPFGPLQADRAATEPCPITPR